MALQQPSKSPASAPRAPDPGDISDHPVLSGLPLDQQWEVLERADAIRVANQEIIFLEGQPARHIYICREGQLRLYRLAANGNEKIVGLVDPGESFAEAAAFMQEATYPVSCSALRASELVRFDARHLVSLLERSPQSCIRLLGLVCGRLRNRVSDIESLALQNAQLRIVNYLLRLHERDGEVIRLPASKKHIASMLAVQPETLSRVLTSLQDSAMIRVERRKLHVLDGARMAAVAEGREKL